MPGQGYGRFRHNAGGFDVEVGGGTVRKASKHPAKNKRGGSGINSGKGPAVSQPVPKRGKGGGHDAHTNKKRAIQNKGSRRPYPM